MLKLKASQFINLVFAGFAAAALVGCGANAPVKVTSTNRPVPEFKEKGEIKYAKGTLEEKLAGDWEGKPQTSEVKKKNSPKQVIGAGKGVSPDLIENLGGYTLSLGKDGRCLLTMTTTPIEGTWTLKEKVVTVTPTKVFEQTVEEIQAEKDSLIKDLAKPKKFLIEKSGTELLYKNPGEIEIVFVRIPAKTR